MSMRASFIGCGPAVRGREQKALAVRGFRQTTSAAYLGATLETRPRGHVAAPKTETTRCGAMRWSISTARFPNRGR
jgi:hypothetical protein